MLRHQTIFRAPENDQGFEDDPDVDVEDFAEDDEPEDEEEPEDEDEPVEEDDEPAPAARQPTRGENRVAAATRAAKEAKEEAAAVKAELAALRAQSSRPQGESQQQRAERLANMEPWERTEFLTNERLAAMEWQGAERLDKMSFDAVCRDDPIAQRMRSDIEARLAGMRANGFNVDRDVLYTQMLGEMARKNKGRAEGKARKTAAANKDRQTARPGQSRGDTAPADRRNNNAAARNKRLENMSI